MRSIFIATLLCVALITGCTNSDGSDPTTYSSCSITSSSALFATDRARDVSQCWDGVDYDEYSLANNWCTSKVNSYMKRYVFGHSIRFQVASTNCP
jgi:hypothetical protein